MFTKNHFVYKYTTSFLTGKEVLYVPCARADSSKFVLSYPFPNATAYAQNMFVLCGHAELSLWYKTFQPLFPFSYEYIGNFKPDQF